MADEFEIKSEEITSRTRSRWILETYREAPTTKSEGPPVDARDECGHSEWMITSSEYDDRDRAVSTLAFRERKYPEDRNRVVRVEIRVERRHFFEDISGEELQKWHDLAAKGDAEKKAQQG